MEEILAVIHIAVGGAQYADDARRRAENMAAKAFGWNAKVMDWDDRPPKPGESPQVMHECITFGLPTWSYSFVVCR